ncbi:MAG TPA: 50S ribosomal protein L21 [bacterium]|nr:50S ribosomal protein L21 [bacterium]
MFAIVKISGKQYKVSPDETCRVDLQSDKPKSKVKFEEVLLLNNDKEVLVGAPTVPNAYVEAEVLEETRGDHVSIMKFHAKKHYKRTKGHTEHYSLIKILGINEK